jgi:myo-inositol-1(or 4)-monophosphatase
MTLDEQERIRGIAVGIAEEAGALLLSGWQSRPASKTKAAHNDIVTEYDRRAEELVVTRLRAAFPKHAIVGEEGAAIGDTNGECVWYVDPLDGTMNFAHGLPFFGVEMGLMIAGVPAVGAIVAPVLGWTFSGTVGVGATRNGVAISVSQEDTIGRALIATGFPSVPNDPTANVAEWVACMKQTHGPRRTGSAAIDLASLACGWFDVHFERNVGPWDIAGGAAIVMAAGGQVTDYDGGKFDPCTGRIIASNGILHADVVAMLGAV